jgi:hypothetical protein
LVLELWNRKEALVKRDDLEDREIWGRIKEVYQEVGESVIGSKNRLKKEWMSEDTWSEIRAQKARAQRDFAEANRRVKRKVLRDKRKWGDEQAMAAEEAVSKEIVKSSIILLRNSLEHVLGRKVLLRIRMEHF